MAMDDSFLRTRPKSTLLDMKPVAERHPAPGTPESSEQDDFVSLPQPGSPYDEAYSRVSNKPVPTLRFIIGDTIRGFPYANYDSIDWLLPDKPGDSPSIVIRFTGLVPREAIIPGRVLLK